MRTHTNKKETLILELARFDGPPLPSIYKVDRRGWRRWENSNVFNFCILATELRTEKRTAAGKKTPAGLSLHITWHSLITLIEVVGSCDDAHFNMSVMQRWLQSLCFYKCKRVLFFQAFSNHMANPESLSFTQPIGILLSNEPWIFRCERPLSKRSALSCDWRPPGKGSVCLTN